jgi:nitrate/nitrite transporter NarK
MELFGWTPTAGGLLFMGFSISCFADPYLGKLANRQGPRLLSMIGFGVSTAGFVALSTVTRDTPTIKALLVSVVVDAYVAQNSSCYCVVMALFVTNLRLILV